MREYYIVTRAGSLNRLKIAKAPVPRASPGRVVVEVKSIGLNYADIFAIMGLYSATPQGTFTPGLEFCGTVAESNSEKYIAGDRVMGVTRFGGYDTFIDADPDYLMPLPSHWSFQEGAAFPVQTLTAYYALRTLGNLRHGQTVLIHSAAGGVGLQANRIARRFNAYTIGVVGHAEKQDLLYKENYNAAIVRGPDFENTLKRALNGRELNLVLEATGGRYFHLSYKAMAPMGRLVAYGSAQFTPRSAAPNYLSLALKYLFRPRIDPLSMIKANKSVMAFNLIWIYERRDLLRLLLDEVYTLALPPPLVGHEFQFQEMRQALEVFKRGKTVGKVVVNV